MILVCAATRAEARACKKGIDAAGLGSPSFEILRTGMGMESARQKLSAHLTVMESLRKAPTLVISSGFAGIWRGSLGVGSWISANEFWKEERSGFSQVNCRSSWVPRDLDAAGPIFSVKVIQKMPSFPSTLSAELVCVDMETAELAAVADEKRIPFGVLRMITDTPAHPLPEFVSIFAQAFQSDDLYEKAKLGGKGLKQVVSDPLSVARFLRNGGAWVDQLAQGWKDRAEAIAESVLR